MDVRMDKDITEYLSLFRATFDTYYELGLTQDTVRNIQSRYESNKISTNSKQLLRNFSMDDLLEKLNVLSDLYSQCVMLTDNFDKNNHTNKTIATINTSTNKYTNTNTDTNVKIEINTLNSVPENITTNLNSNSTGKYLIVFYTNIYIYICIYNIYIYVNIHTHTHIYIHIYIYIQHIRYNIHLHYNTYIAEEITTNLNNIKVNT